ncbi:hypothetical protein [Flaviaesturariibacter amylovorans]|uniref:DUF3098 domain-containing protein n=1 Tax=Flaviaesturariibacter amylovorans TaxID=1084520 RepID=A0ABP8G574_9BACT
MNLQRSLKARVSEAPEASRHSEYIRRDPNYALYLFLIIVGLFGMAMAYLFL